MNNLLILGAGQYGMVAREIVESMDCFDSISFLDDNNPIVIGKIHEYEDFFDNYKYIEESRLKNGFKTNVHYK